MIRPVTRRTRGRASAPRGYTLVEIVLAVLLTLIMLGAVISYFGTVSQTIADSRSALEMIDRLRSAASLLRSDLRGVTVTTVPPRSPDAQEGYFEYTEGPVGPIQSSFGWAVNLNEPGAPADTTVGDMDDMVLFTTRSVGEPFIGRCGNGTIESQVAEVAWFVRGRTLYRRVLLVAPEALSRLDVNPINARIDLAEWTPFGQSFFNGFDISVRWQRDANGTYLMPNSLGDLTKPENRYAHQSGSFPFHPHRVPGWARMPNGSPLPAPLQLPTLCESSSQAGFGDWFDDGVLPAVPLTARATPQNVFDAWVNPYPYNETDPTTGTLLTYNGLRLAEDVVLTNVIGFDVKAWDPMAPVVEVRNGAAATAVMPGDVGYVTALGRAGGAGCRIISRGAYVDLDYALGNAGTPFDGPGVIRPGVPSTTGVLYYDTWSTHYEKDGIDQNGDGVIDSGTNGFDDNGNGNGVVDDPSEMETSPPYPVPLRGIQIKIRCFEPDSRQIREVTVVQEFLPK